MSDKTFEEIVYRASIGAAEAKEVLAALLAWRDKAVAEAEYRGMLRVDKAVLQALNDYMRSFGGSPDPDLAAIYDQLEGNMQRHRLRLAELEKGGER